MNRVRDSRRQKLYDAQREIPDNSTNVLGSVEQTQAFVDKVLSERWFKARWRMGGVEVGAGRGAAATSWHGQRRITVGPKARNPLIVLHELAHQIIERATPDGRRMAAHGPEFAYLNLWLYEKVCGRDKANELRAAYVRHGVKYRTGASVIPQPRFEVPSQAAAREEKKAAANRPLKTQERRDAAEVIRVAVKRGEFGAAGSKARIAALAVARKLVEGTN